MVSDNVVTGALRFACLGAAILCAFTNSVAQPAPATPGVCYGSTGFVDGGRLLTVDPVTGSGTLVADVPGLTRVSGLAINSAGELYGVDGESPTSLYRIDAVTGVATLIGSTGLDRVDAIAFDELNRLYAAVTQGAAGLFILNVTTASAISIGGLDGIEMAALAFDPTDGTLYGSGRAGNDAIYIIDTTSSATTLIGLTGLGGATPALMFDEAGNLYGSKGGGQAVNTLIAIDKATAVGTPIGSIGFIAVAGLDCHPSNPVPPPASATTCYGSTGFVDGGRLLTVDPVTGSGTLVADVPGLTRVSGLAIDSAGELYGVDGESPTSLYRIDAVTGVATLIGSTGLDRLDAIAFDEFDVLYAAQTQSGSGLFIIDAATAVPTPIGSLDGIQMGALAFDPTDGTLYGSGRAGNDAIYVIDTTSSATTLIGLTGLGGATPALMFDEAGNLYGSKGGGQTINTLIAIDKATAVGIPIGNIGFIAVAGLDCFLPAMEIPATDRWGLVALTLLLALAVGFKVLVLRSM